MITIAGTAYFAKLYPEAILPKYSSDLAACCDLYIPRLEYIDAQQEKLIGLGLVAIPPIGWHWHIYLRSSTPWKYTGLELMNYVGIIDGDYCGPDDELKLSLRNTGDTNSILLVPGTRIAQMRLVQNAQALIEEIPYDQIAERRSRGGLGSTGQ